MKYKIELRFNSRGAGSGQKWNGTVEAETFDEAFIKASNEAVSQPEHGQSICVTGGTFDVVQS